MPADYTGSLTPSHTRTMRERGEAARQRPVPVYGASHAVADALLDEVAVCLTTPAVLSPETRTGLSLTVHRASGDSTPTA